MRCCGLELHREILSGAARHGVRRLRGRSPAASSDSWTASPPGQGRSTRRLVYKPERVRPDPPDPEPPDVGAHPPGRDPARGRRRARARRRRSGGGGRRRARRRRRRGARSSLDAFSSASGVPASLIQAVEREGIRIGHDVDGETRYTSGDIELVRTALRLLEFGLPLGDLLALAREADAAMRGLADRAVELFDEHVRKPIRDTAAGDRRRVRRAMVEAFQELLPAVTLLVSHHFRRVLLEVAEEHIEAPAASEAPQASRRSAAAPRRTDETAPRAGRCPRARRRRARSGGSSTRSAPATTSSTSVMTFGMDRWLATADRARARVPDGLLRLRPRLRDGDLSAGSRAPATARGFDFSHGMLLPARTGAPLVEADIQRLPVRDGYADGATSVPPCATWYRCPLCSPSSPASFDREGGTPCSRPREPGRTWLRLVHRLYFRRIVPAIDGLLSNRGALLVPPPVDRVPASLRRAVCCCFAPQGSPTRDGTSLSIFITRDSSSGHARDQATRSRRWRRMPTRSATPSTSPPRTDATDSILLRATQTRHRRDSNRDPAGAPSTWYKPIRSSARRRRILRSTNTTWNQRRSGGSRGQ